LASDFQYVRDLFESKQAQEPEVENVLSDVLFEFFDAHDRLEDFVKWAVINEIRKTGAAFIIIYRAHSPLN
jgi:hypothetical protein